MTTTKQAAKALRILAMRRAVGQDQKDILALANRLEEEEPKQLSPQYRAWYARNNKEKAPDYR